MASPPFTHERQIAELAIQRATILTRHVLTLVNKGELSKSDDSPVSLADFGAQALLVAALHTAFPEDPIIGEESAAALRENAQLRRQVWDLVRQTSLDDAEVEKLLGRPRSEEEMCDLIDLGAGTDSSNKGRVWTIDPVDGTKTFLEGRQYGVVAALLVDGVDVLGVIGCPKVDLESGEISEDDVAQDGPGIIVSAIRGQGVLVRTMSTGALLPAQTVPKRKPKSDLSKLVFVENIHNHTPRFPNRQQFAERLGVSWPPVYLYSSSITYCALALGIVDYQIRAPIPTAAPSCIWDHAGGMLIFEEVGGKVSDLRGNKIDLSLGRPLSANYGNIGADDILLPKMVDLVAALYNEFPDKSWTTALYRNPTA